jgi:alpha-mannosidase
MYKSILFCTILYSFSSGLYAQQKEKRLYLGNDTHTDLMFNATEAKWDSLILDMADFYLKLGEQTIGEEPAHRSKWNYDAAYWLWVLEHKTSPEYFQRIIAQIKNQQASVPYNFTLPIYGASTMESILRSFYYGGYLERKFGIDVDIAVCQENATIPLGLASLWAGSGAKYSWKGVCNCATKTSTKGLRKNEIYWYKGLDENKILMKWYSNFGWNAELGGYAEMLEPTVAVIQMDTLCGSTRYPYLIAGAFGKGWDNMINYSFDIQWGINRRTRPGTKLFISNELDFFQDFEKTYGQNLPKEILAYGNEWDLLPASLSAVTGKIRASMEKLRAAEGMAAIITRDKPTAFSSLTAMKEKFMYAVSVINVHGWTSDGPVTKKQLARWIKEKQLDITNYVDSLYDEAAKILANQITSKKDKVRFYVFNPLNWERTDFADIKYAGASNIEIKDLSKNKIVPSQIIHKSDGKYIRILATGIPSVGYKVYEINTTQKAKENSPFHFVNNILETPFYSIGIAKSGVITSLVEKSTGREFVRNIGGLYSNDLGSAIQDSSGQITMIDEGGVSITIQCESSSPIKHISKITVFKSIPRIDIQNEIHQNFGTPQHYTYSFNIDNPTMWHEEIGAIIKAKTASEGGHYADTNARYDYLTSNHFANVSNKDFGLTVSNLNCLFLKLGESTAKKLDSRSSQLRFLAGGQIDKDLNLGIIDQDGDSLFHHSLSLIPHSGPYNQNASMKKAMEHQNPFVTASLSEGKKYPEKQHSFLKVNNSNLILWTLKPGEDNGTVVRFWNMNNHSVDAMLNFDKKPTLAEAVTHVETPVKQLSILKDAVKCSFSKQELCTFKIKF